METIEVLEKHDATPISTIIESELRTQIEFARRNPRIVKRFRESLFDMVAISPRVAEECMYSVPRAGKQIQGASVRFAELLVMAWGNCQVGARIIAEEDGHVVAQGVFRDLEKNTTVTSEVRRRITDKKGRRYSPDMIITTSNAACAIARRNAALGAIPRMFWIEAYEHGRMVAIGDVQSLAERRDNMLKAYQAWNITTEQILEFLGLTEEHGAEDITGEHVLHMRALYRQIKDGETDIDEAFNPNPFTNESSDEILERAVAKSKPAPKLEEAKPTEVPFDDPAEAAPAFTEQFTDDIKPAESFLLLFGGIDENTLLQLVQLFTGSKSIKNPEAIANGMLKKYNGALRTVAEAFGDAVSTAEFLMFALDEYEKLSRADDLKKAIEQFKSEQ